MKNYWLRKRISGGDVVRILPLAIGNSAVIIATAGDVIGDESECLWFVGGHLHRAKVKVKFLEKVL
jgi:hypothetical protein